LPKKLTFRKFWNFRKVDIQIEHKKQVTFSAANDNSEKSTTKALSGGEC